MLHRPVELANYIGNIISNNATGILTFVTIPAFTGATALEDFLTGTVTSGLLLTENATRNINYNRYAGGIDINSRERDFGRYRLMSATAIAAVTIAVAMIPYVREDWNRNIS